MIGPNQSIIWCFTSTGQGAAACRTHSRLETSYLARTSSGSFSMRTNMVGTNWAWVTRYCSISCSTPSGSNLRIRIDRGPHPVHGHGVVHPGGVVQRGGGQVDTRYPHPVPVAQGSFEYGLGPRTVRFGEGTSHCLGPARRTGRVQHLAAVRPLRHHLGRRRRVFVGPPTGQWFAYRDPVRTRG